MARQPEFASAKDIAGEPEDRAAEVLAATGITAPPVSGLAAIARSRGVSEIRVDKSLGLDGFTYVDHNALVICVRDAASARGRFTIAHEIGHSYFYEVVGGRPPRPVPTVGAKEEGWCHVYARCLLMPRSWLRADTLDIEDPSLTKLTEIADRYQVSPEALAWRLQDVGTWPTLVLLGHRRQDGWLLRNVMTQSYFGKGKIGLRSGGPHPLSDLLDAAVPGALHAGEVSFPTLRLRRPGRLFVETELWTESRIYSVAGGSQFAISLVHLGPSPLTLARLERAAVPVSQLALPFE